MMKKLFVVVLGSIILAGCSPEQLFELVAKSDIEMAASDSVNQSADLIKAYDDLVNAKKAEYDASVKLESVVGDASYGYAMKNDFDPTTGFALFVIAILPPLAGESNFYEGWLVNPDTNTVISTGRLILDESNQARTLTFTAPRDYPSFTKVLITQQTGSQTKPETAVLSGDF